MSKQTGQASLLFGPYSTEYCIVWNFKLTTAKHYVHSAYTLFTYHL